MENEANNSSYNNTRTNKTNPKRGPSELACGVIVIAWSAVVAAAFEGLRPLNGKPLTPENKQISSATQHSKAQHTTPTNRWQSRSRS